MGIPVFGAGVTKNIKAIFNSAVVKVDGKVDGGDKISYNNNVYINAKEIAKIMGKTYSEKAGTIKNNSNDNSKGKYQSLTEEEIKKCLKEAKEANEYDDSSYILPLNSNLSGKEGLGILSDSTVVKIVTPYSCVKLLAFSKYSNMKDYSIEQAKKDLKDNLNGILT